MDDRKWENLPLDLLVDILSRVGVLSLVESLPFVCKSWYQATLNPLCWKSLSFPQIDESRLFCDKYDDFMKRGHYYLEKLVCFAIRRSLGSVTAVAFPRYFPMTQDVLNSIGEGCPSLKRLVLPVFDFYHKNLLLLSLIRKCKDLEALEIGRGFMLEKVIPEISVHCKKFRSLTVFDANIGESIANAISTLLPDIEFLSLKQSYIHRSNLMTILNGCKRLVCFDAGLWLDFNVDDEIKNVAADIVTFKFEVSVPRYCSGCDEDDSDYGYHDNGIVNYSDDSDSDSESDSDYDYSC